MTSFSSVYADALCDGGIKSGFYYVNCRGRGGREVVMMGEDGGVKRCVR